MIVGNEQKANKSDARLIRIDNKANQLRIRFRPLRRYKIMPAADIIYPEPRTAGLYYLEQGPPFTKFAALQGLRSGRMKPNEAGAIEYFSMAWLHAKQLAKEVNGSYDAMVVPPSTHNRSEPYAKELINCCQWNLSGGFSRAGVVRSGDGCSLGQLWSSVSYKPSGEEGKLRSVLVVDDIFASGKTVAIMVGKLIEAGMSKEAVVSVACPLWISSNFKIEK